MLDEKDFLTRFLISWQVCYQPKGCQYFYLIFFTSGLAFRSILEFCTAIDHKHNPYWMQWQCLMPGWHAPLLSRERWDYESSYGFQTNCSVKCCDRTWTTRMSFSLHWRDSNRWEKWLNLLWWWKEVKRFCWPCNAQCYHQSTSLIKCWYSHTDKIFKGGSHLQWILVVESEDSAFCISWKMLKYQ